MHIASPPCASRGRADGFMPYALPPSRLHAERPRQPGQGKEWHRVRPADRPSGLEIRRYARTPFPPPFLCSPALPPPSRLAKGTTHRPREPCVADGLAAAASKIVFTHVTHACRQHANPLPDPLPDPPPPPPRPRVVGMP